MGRERISLTLMPLPWYNKLVQINQANFLLIPFILLYVADNWLQNSMSLESYEHSYSVCSEV